MQPAEAPEGGAPAVHTHSRKLGLEDMIAGPEGIYLESRARFIRRGLLDVNGHPVIDGDAPFPDVDEVIGWVQTGLTPKQRELFGDTRVVQELVGRIHPVVHAERRIAALNAHKPLEGQIDAAVSDHAKQIIIPRADERNGLVTISEEERIIRPTIAKWLLGFGEGHPAPGLLPDEDGKWSLLERVFWARGKFGDKDGLHGMDLLRYIDLMEESIDHGTPIDDIFETSRWTMLDGEYETGDETIMGGLWYEGERQVDLAESRIHIPDGARTRLWTVMSSQV